ncbi:adrenodoxin-like protein 1, mitochondrial isoform X2 [Centruroides vittatus]|uniref:adrenodoxin-like protein 1, mitochondrial isoform X2 n=1 Tax=Centruroides vittatus TaxID=120091 RepID=UPI00350F4ACA
MVVQHGLQCLRLTRFVNTRFARKFFFCLDSLFQRNINENWRNFQTSSHCFDKRFEWEDPKSEDEIVTVNFILKDGKQVTVNGKIGDNVMYLAQRHGIEIEGACEASLACTTCHVYVDDKYLEKLTPAEEKEEDLLDMAPFLKTNSRLGNKKFLC